MNRARAMKAFVELLDALEETVEEERPHPRARRLPVAPPGEVDEVTRARARAIMREKGYRDAR